MRLALVSFEVSKYSGVGRYAYYIAKLLNPTIFSNRVNTEHSNPFVFIPTIRGPALISKNLFCLISTLVCKRDNFDIVHSMGASCLHPDCVTAHTSARATLRLLEVGGLFRELSPIRHIYWRFRLFIPSILERWLYRKNIHIISVSMLLKEMLMRDYGIPEAKITVIYPGVDTEEFQPSSRLREKARRELGLKGNVVLFVGGQERRKGLPFLIEALKGFNVTLLLCGTGVQWLAIARNNLENVVYIPHPASMSSIYNACDIFILPSLFDSFGFPVLEAMASGLPVILSRHTGASEILDDGCGMVIEDPRNVREIRNKIDFILGDKNRLISMKTKSREIALKYDLDSFKNNLFEFYSRIYK